MPYLNRCQVPEAPAQYGFTPHRLHFASRVCDIRRNGRRALAPGMARAAATRAWDVDRPTSGSGGW